MLEYFEHLAFGLAYLLRSGWEKLRQAFHGCHALFEELGIVVPQGYRCRPCSLTLLSELFAHHADFFKRFQEQG